ncbi:hypothetical protein H6P81_009903 [Aristolochia fimbriata]|uniref:Uncharacterized protein n=1 Tax=Aristolochia fimbriata TaxID=158543 RepID=A0AAV7EMD2_ARIFI|nr:hypothetical protein H6P81_009903 [Aristolochia fimbriata]
MKLKEDSHSRDSQPVRRKGDPENGFNTSYPAKPAGNGERSAKVAENREFRPAKPFQHEDLNANIKPVETGNAAK